MYWKEYFLLFLYTFPYCLNFFYKWYRNCVIVKLPSERLCYSLVNESGPVPHTHEYTTYEQYFKALLSYFEICITVVFSILKIVILNNILAYFIF